MKYAGHRTANTGLFHLYDASKIVKLIEKMQQWLPEMGRGGNEELLIKGYKISIMQMNMF